MELKDFIQFCRPQGNLFHCKTLYPLNSNADMFTVERKSESGIVEK